MKSIEETYRERLALLIDEFGGQAKLSQVIDKSPAQISQWLHGTPSGKTGKQRTLKPATAREIEKATGKPYAWFDQPLINDSTSLTCNITSNDLNHEIEKLKLMIQHKDELLAQKDRELAAKDEIIVLLRQ